MKSLHLISKIFFPERCVHCHRLIPLSDKVCLKCESKSCYIPETFCPYCGRRKCVCPDIDRKLRHITAPFLYSGIIRKSILHLKFRKEKSYADFLSEEMYKKVIESFCDVSFDLVTFVPMDEEAKRKRGYNQSELLAKRIAKRLFLPTKDLLVKSKSSLKQHHLSHEMRKENIKNVFSLKSGVNIDGKTVLLCDDIKTTGSTLLECEALLLSGGASDVYCVVAAIPVYGKAAPRLDKDEKNI